MPKVVKPKTKEQGRLEEEPEIVKPGTQREGSRPCLSHFFAG
jgi:hypothetical protein